MLGENFALGEALPAKAALGMAQAVAFLDRLLGARRGRSSETRSPRERVIA